MVVIITSEWEVRRPWRVQGIPMVTTRISSASGRWWRRSTTGSFWRWTRSISKQEPADMTAFDSSTDVRDCRSLINPNCSVNWMNSIVCLFVWTQVMDILLWACSVAGITRARWWQHRPTRCRSYSAPILPSIAPDFCSPPAQVPTSVARWLLIDLLGNRAMMQIT